MNCLSTKRLASSAFLARLMLNRQTKLLVLLLPAIGLERLTVNKATIEIFNYYCRFSAISLKNCLKIANSNFQNKCQLTSKNDFLSLPEASPLLILHLIAKLRATF